jgi:hypothetical protein
LKTSLRKSELQNLIMKLSSRPRQFRDFCVPISKHIEVSIDTFFMNFIKGAA